MLRFRGSANSTIVFVAPTTGINNDLHIEVFTELDQNLQQLRIDSVEPAPALAGELGATEEFM